MRIDNSAYGASKGLFETEPLLKDLTRQAAKRLEQFQHQQVKTKIAFQKAVLAVAGYGGSVDTYV